MIRRRMTFTSCHVISPSGELLGEVMYTGKLSPARLAKVARRMYKNQLATITDYTVKQKVYEIEEEKFLEYATEVKE